MQAVISSPCQVALTKQTRSLLFLSQSKWGICCATHSCCGTVRGQNPLTAVPQEAFETQAFHFSCQLRHTWHRTLSTTYPRFFIPHLSQQGRSSVKRIPHQTWPDLWSSWFNDVVVFAATASLHTVAWSALSLCTGCSVCDWAPWEAN